jgi:UDP-N-acetylglucosamine diphosphorylase / glucose-1-phosphate thymidylyltransferase / UDP-N-acetylgalactosamine diphosphorylase / glucosamine-1-phosphate N-acetyltransferase / galactosamine-1-phosphate N-acetyltransferase
VKRFLLLYENPRWERLSPVADLLPVPGLRFGASTLGARWLAALGLPLFAVEARAGALAAWREPLRIAAERPEPGDEVLVVDAAALPGGWLTGLVEAGGPALFLAEGEPVAARLPFDALMPCLGAGAAFESRLADLALPQVAVEARVLRWPWDLVAHNVAALEADLAARRGRIEGTVDANVALLERGLITVGAGARVDPFAVLDARGGPILVGRDAVVLAHSVIEGPCAIGAGSQVLGGVVRRSSVGPQCRVAGEVEDTVWQGWANKRHHGFVGHSLVGEWVNLGALTTTSDLKNNYGPVRVWAAGRERESGSSKVGSIIGAHVKTGIGSLLTTGCSIGVGSNLFGGGRFAPKRVPAFAWWDGRRTLDHRLEPCLATAAVVLGRRGLVLGEAEQAALRELFASSAAERAVATGADPATGR